MDTIIYLILTGATALATSAANVTDRFVFKKGTGAKLLQPCSRSQVANVDGFWTPSISNIDLLEKKIETCISHPLLKPISKYHRQYIGIVRGKKKLIYMSAIIKDTSSRNLDLTEPVIVCDGQTDAFGVEYNIEDRKFQNFEFNGPSGPETAGAILKNCTVQSD